MSGSKRAVCAPDPGKAAALVASLKRTGPKAPGTPAKPTSGTGSSPEGPDTPAPTSEKTSSTPLTGASKKSSLGFNVPLQVSELPIPVFKHPASGVKEVYHSVVVVSARHFPVSECKCSGFDQKGEIVSD